MRRPTKIFVHDPLLQPEFRRNSECDNLDRYPSLAAGRMLAHYIHFNYAPEITVERIPLSRGNPRYFCASQIHYEGMHLPV